ncbi:MAG TPA: cytochrome B [Gammaproteobacteria bacterium]|nr:cytochrome B [Gammaproteobacteria bacterium]
MTTDARREEVKVWDPLVRIFHWSLVVTFTVAYLSGEEFEQLHIYSGYVIAGLLVFRLLWGFIGTRHARFSDFIYSRQEIVDYLRSLLSAKPRHYLGHNPAGGVMVILLLLSLAFTVGTGLVLDTEPAGGEAVASARHEPVAGGWLAWAGDHDDDEKEGREDGMLEEVHEFFANLSLLLVFIHVAGVVVSGWIHRENLVRAMITGRKTVEPRAGGETP